MIKDVGLEVYFTGKKQRALETYRPDQSGSFKNEGSVFIKIAKISIVISC
jgi:hypothetical protein